MTEYHQKIAGLCYKAKASSGLPNIILMEYLKIAGMEREYEAEYSKYFRHNPRLFPDYFEWTYCTEHSEASND